MKIRMRVSVRNIATLLVLSLAYLVPRICGLGFNVINIDYPLWDNRASNFFIYLKTFNFAETYRSSHPGVTLMWIGGGAMEVFSKLYGHFFNSEPVINEISIFPWRSLFIKLALVFSILFLYLIALYLIERLFSKGVALLFFILVAFEPYIIAHDRLFHLDGLLAASIFVSCLFSIYFWKVLKFRYLLASAALASFAFLTKVTGVFAFLFFFLAYIVIRGYTKAEKRVTPLYWWGVFTFLFSVFAVAFFPAMWVAPLDTLSKMFSGAFSLLESGHSQYFLGRWTNDPGILFYPVVFLFKSSPIIILWVLGLAGWVFWRGKKLKKASVDTTLLGFFVLFYLIEIFLSAKKVPRYLLPIYPPILLLTSVSIAKAYKMSRGKIRRRIIFSFSIILSFSIFATFKAYPYFLAYENPVLGGMKSADYYIGNKHFGFGLKDVANYLNKKPYISESRLIFSGDGSIGPFFKGMARNETYIFRDSVSRADYFLLPYYLVERDEVFLEVKKDFELEKVFNVNGYPYWYLYRNVRIN